MCVLGDFDVVFKYLLSIICLEPAADHIGRSQLPPHANFSGPNLNFHKLMEPWRTPLYSTLGFVKSMICVMFSDLKCRSAIVCVALPDSEFCERSAPSTIPTSKFLVIS